MVETLLVLAHNTLHSNNTYPETFWWFFIFICAVILDVGSSSLICDLGKNMENIIISV